MNKKIIGILIACLIIGTGLLPLINGEENDYYLLQKNIDYNLNRLETNTQDNIKVNT